MKFQITLCAIALSILIMGCSAGSVPGKITNSNSVKSGQPPATAPSVSQSPTKLGQMLPISAEADIAGERIGLEVAQTPEQQAMGLMYRLSLAPDRGMLFGFDPPRRVSFWMKNVKIYLDMVFLRNGEVKAIAKSVPPCQTDKCPTYGPGKEIIDQVIELRGGRAAELGLKVGDQVTVKFLD
ncbi:DUF192 domain-containing protein, partial [Moorena sp. SIO3B2]|uniref:DUF192 domain-containing protein n=1 Tax=Moorena sp. SIO3B2 TaxID=2607827 RepID=UPI0013C9170A